MRETDPNKMSNTEWERWAKDRIAELEAIMKELADDVKAYADAEFSGRDIWPTYQRKWELAMDVVNRARALLGGGE